ncbi:calcium-binding protein [Leisingera daeponensis]|uniref:calcium-binding protein n=1 Tax=Leisingera daeponensis TaxID=405746 RepID=UPI001C93CBA6|nr:calcium-binding protein [Leisingera daeponensis]MBY6054902.1 hypothetical protein [Leisingera daeponensis]
MTVPNATATFTYSITGYDDGVAIIDMNDNVIQAIIGGVNLDNPGFTVNSEETLITQVTWSGGTSVVLIVSLETGPATDTEFYFVLDGAPLPDVDSVADWNNFDASITGLTDPTGALAPGRVISWASLDHTGTTEHDEFWGTPGADTYFGNAGDDFFVSSAGADTYRGGNGGFDQVAFTWDPNGVTANLATGQATDGWGRTDRLFSIEMLRGSAHNDLLIGNGGRNYFRGIEGNDTIRGGSGRDEVRYDRDARYGGTNGVEVDLATQTATDGFGDTDRVFSIEDVRGSAKGDRIFGNSAANKLDGEAGFDRLLGRNGNDLLLGDGGNDTLNGGDGRDTLNGGVGRDLLLGGRHNDRLAGAGGNDTLNGGGGNDTLFGGTGNDRMIGAAGNDRLFGNGGSDTFVFANGFGKDTIGGFNALDNNEKINLSAVSSITGLTDLRNNHMTQSGNDVIIDDRSGNTITLTGVQLSDLDAGDFIF